jgi:hypothetical protein
MSHKNKREDGPGDKTADGDPTPAPTEALTVNELFGRPARLQRPQPGPITSQHTKKCGACNKPLPSNAIQCDVCAAGMTAAALGGLNMQHRRAG